MFRSVQRKARGLAASVVVLCAAMVAASPAALANNPQVSGVFNDWPAYSFEESSGKVCYMASQPRRAEGNYTARGDIFTLITHRPGENSRDVVSYVAGYTYQANSEVQIQIGNRTFTLFTQADRAWAYDDETDRALSSAIQRGSNMVVRGTSARGTQTTDTYSLSGSTAAYRAISEACNVPVN